MPTGIGNIDGEPPNPPEKSSMSTPSSPSATPPGSTEILKQRSVQPLLVPKTEEQIVRAIKLLSLLLNNEVKLPHPIPPNVILNTQGVVRALQWTIGLSRIQPLDDLLDEIERATEGPSFNPHQNLNE